MNKKLNKLIVVGANRVFPWELKQELQVDSIMGVGANVYDIEIDGKPFVFQLQETILAKESFLIKIFLTDTENSGTVVFEPIYE
jgi:hypothetical protein